jgi:cholesterol transport system auxiliary component
MAPVVVSRRAATTLLAVALAGCTSMLAGPARQLYQVTPKTTFPPGLPHVPAQLLIDLPVAPAGLDTTLIALSQSAVSIDYFAGAEWTDRVPALVQAEMVDSFTNSRTFAAVDRVASGLLADLILESEIRHFEAQYSSPSTPPTAYVAINLRLVRMPDRVITGQTSVTRKRPASSNDVPHIVLAFNDALGGVMKDIVAWTARNAALPRPRG